MELRQVPLLSKLSGRSHIDEFKFERLPFLDRTLNECGAMARVDFRGRSVIIVNEPQAAHEVLVEKARAFEKSPGARLVLYPLGGEGLFTSERDLWKRQRKLMSPLFHQREIAAFAACMTEAASRSAALMREGERLEVARATTRIAMSVVGKALFDADTFDEADDLGAALTVALEWADTILGTRGMYLQLFARRLARRIREEGPALLRAPALGVLAALEMPYQFYLPGSHAIRGAIAKIDSRVARMIAERRTVGLTRQDLLSQLLRARDEDDGERMTDKQVRDEAVTLFVAGHETTAMGLAWACYELAKAPAMLARVQREADRFGGKTPALEDLGGLAYSLRVFKEALRMYPPVYLLMRMATSDVDIAGVAVPKGTVVMVSGYGIHRNPAVYPDPERFDPDRFEPAAEAARHRSAWLPFGSGPRVCIGHHFALLEGQLVLATLAHHVSFEPIAGVEVRPNPRATLRPSGGMPMIVRRRRAPGSGAPPGTLSPAA
jgi:cytochrome P450